MIGIEDHTKKSKESTVTIATIGKRVRTVSFETLYTKLITRFNDFDPRVVTGTCP